MNEFILYGDWIEIVFYIIDCENEIICKFNVLNLILLYNMCFLILMIFYYYVLCVN